MDTTMSFYKGRIHNCIYKLNAYTLYREKETLGHFGFGFLDERWHRIRRVSWVALVRWVYN